MNPPAASLPILSHLTRSDFENIYEPAEDTYLFVDTLYFDKLFLNNLRPSICLELGGGSGCVSAALGMVLDHPAAMFVTDINRRAAKASMQTLMCNNLNDNVVCCDLFSNLASRLSGRVDVILFNPPYVVTPSEEIGESLIASSWAGGVDGREVLDRILTQIVDVLSPIGVFYLIAIEENKPDDICKQLLGSGMKTAEIFTRRTAFNERLMIIKATKNEIIK